MQLAIYVYFLITDSEVEPDEITKALGIKPSDTWRVGDLIDSTSAIRRKKNGWRLYSPLNNSEPIEEHMLIILEKFQNNWKSVVEVCSNYHVRLYCSIYCRNEVPAIHFDKNIMQKVIELNAAIDVDLYVLSEFPDKPLEKELFDI